MCAGVPVAGQERGRVHHRGGAQGPRHQPRNHDPGQPYQRGCTVFRVWEAFSNLTHAQHFYIASRNHSINKLKNHIANRKIYEVMPGKLII